MLKKPRNYPTDLKVFRSWARGDKSIDIAKRLFINRDSVYAAIQRILKHHFILSATKAIEVSKEPAYPSELSNIRRVRYNKEYWLAEADKLEEFWNKQQ